MPRGDGTGPMGMGPMTGRGAGYCAGFGAPGYMNPSGGRGFGFGKGRGFGFGRGFGRGMGCRWFFGNPYYGAAPFAGYPMAPTYQDPSADPYAVWQATPKQEMEILQSQAEMLGEQLAGIKKRIEELEKSAEKDK